MLLDDVADDIVDLFGALILVSMLYDYIFQKYTLVFTLKKDHRCSIN